MLRQIGIRARQGHATFPFHKSLPTLPERDRGLPNIDPAKCIDGCRECVESCPTEAIAIGEHRPRIDLGRCVVCGDYVDACPENAIDMTTDYRLAATHRVRWTPKTRQMVNLQSGS